MKERRITPPRWMDKIIELYCSRSLLEDLQGDLHEYYSRNLPKGRFRADLIYLLDVLKFFRPYTVRELKILGQMTFFNLLGNYWKTSLRSIARNKLFSTINMVGLAISMSVGLLMITYISEALTFDEFHEKKERIYRITSDYASVTYPDPFKMASTSVFIADKLRSGYSGIEKVVTIRRHFVADISKGENIINVHGHYVTEEFFDVLSFELLSGVPTTAFKEPNSVVLTETSAQKLFKDENPVGQIVEAGDDSYTITGVVKDPPLNSHIRFEALASFPTVANKYKDDPNTNFYDWGSIWMNHVYLLLEEETKAETVQGYLDQIAEVENAKTDRFTINHEVENIRKVSPGRDLSNQLGANMTWKSIFQLLGLTFVVILSACFNYTNLSIARSLRRAKEVGIRKVVGATRSQVLTQFVFEAILISIISLVLAVGLFIMIKPEFINSVIDGENVLMEFRWNHVFLFLLFAVAIGFFSGILPSLVLSKLKAISILTDVTKLRLFKGINLRKVLIVFQFAISMALIIGANIMYRQYNFSINYDLGFTSENVLNLNMYGNDSELFKAEFMKLPEVSAISRSGMIPSTGEIWSEYFKYEDPLDSVSVRINLTDKNYTMVHELTFLAGETFPADLSEGEESKYIIIDRNYSERLGFEDPFEALGETLEMQRRSGNTAMQVVGVIENYRYTNLESDVKPTALLQATTNDYVHLNMKVKTADVMGLMDKMESIWADVEKLHPFRAQFMDDQIQNSYIHYKVVYRIFTFLAILAISISTMGLLGIAVFTTETRIKEISIRKVLGATEKNLVVILSKSFMLMFLISALIAIPFAYYFFTEVVLVDFKERISIGPTELLPGVLLIGLIGFATIGWQIMKAAKSNPADMLRDE